MTRRHNRTRTLESPFHAAATALTAILFCAAPSAVADELAKLQDHLDRYVAGARPALYDGVKCFDDDQRLWMKNVRDACRGETQCLTIALRARLTALHPLQPGAAALGDLEMPGVPTLETVIPPVPGVDSGTTGDTPMEIVGQLVRENEDIDNLGLAVRDAQSAPHVFVYDMDIGSSPTHDPVRAHIRNGTDATFRVVGIKAPSGTLAHDRCRFVYRLR